MNFEGITAAWIEDDGTLVWRGETAGGCVPKGHPRYEMVRKELEEGEIVIGNRDPALPN